MPGKVENKKLEEYDIGSISAALSCQFGEERGLPSWTAAGNRA